MKRVKDAFDERAAALDGLLGVGRSFDMIGRTLRIGGRRARLWVVNGYADDTVLERAISAWLPIPSLEDVGTLQAFADRYVSVCDAAVETDRLKAVTAVFAGKTLLVIDGFSGGVVLVYMAFVAIANYAQHSYEMGYAVKLCRMALLLLIWLFDWWGFIGGILGTLALIASTRPLIGKGYLYPFIPFNGKDLWALLHHRPIDRNNS